ncbi:MAG: hypothetical protein Fur0022_45010 [Anaerolineales bacterium]
MSQQLAPLQGLACPNCGGTVPIPEGQPIVICPYCEQRSLVRGERGLRRYQVPLRIDRNQALQATKAFFTSNLAIARDLTQQAKLQEDFVVYLPFWVQWGRVLGWVFGQEKVGSGKNQRYVPREVKIAEEMTWNGAACDVGEFGVTQIPFTTQTPVEPFQSEQLHEIGMVFEPIGAQSDAEKTACADFEARVKQMASIDRVEQMVVRTISPRLGLVYYPLYVLRYLYRGRSFQVAVDGLSGKVLYGKAPGNTWYRAGIMVAGMALGAFLIVDVCALVSYFSILAASADDDALGGLIFALLAVAAGVGAITTGYRRFRYGEVYEFRGHEKKKRRTQRNMEGGVHRAREIQG